MAEPNSRPETLWQHTAATDGNVPRTGIYETTCPCRVATKMSKGSSAPLCPVCTAPTVWKLKA